MLVIRNEQMRILQAPRRERFEERVAQHLVEVFEDAVADGPELRALITRGFDKALSYDFESEKEVVGFIEWMVELGPEFDEIPWATRILNHRGYDGGEKLRIIENYWSALNGERA